MSLKGAGYVLQQCNSANAASFSFRKSVTVLISFVSDIPVDNNRGLPKLNKCEMSGKFEKSAEATLNAFAPNSFILSALISSQGVQRYVKSLVFAYSASFLCYSEVSSNFWIRSYTYSEPKS